MGAGMEEAFLSHHDASYCIIIRPILPAVVRCF